MTEPIKITRAKALQMLDAAVKERGEDYVAPVCQYWNIDSRRPGCIIGLALYREGIKAPVLREMDRPDNTSINSSRVIEILQRKGVVITPAALTAMRAAQATQDMQHPWQRALKQAKAGAPASDYPSAEAKALGL